MRALLAAAAALPTMANAPLPNPLVGAPLLFNWRLPYFQQQKNIALDEQ
jgi:hypothetical protein